VSLLLCDAWHEFNLSEQRLAIFEIAVPSNAKRLLCNLRYALKGGLRYPNQSRLHEIGKSIGHDHVQRLTLDSIASRLAYSSSSDRKQLPSKMVNRLAPPSMHQSAFLPICAASTCINLVAHLVLPAVRPFRGINCFLV